MKKEIIKLLNEIGITEVGFCNIKELIVDYSKYELQNSLGYKCTFQTGNIGDKDLKDKKYNEYNTAIVILLPYKKVNFSNKNNVYFSSIAVGVDYHLTIRNKLNVVAEYLNNNNYKYEIFVDNNPLDERVLAYNSGLGFFGKNNLLINNKYGSYFNIGIILTNAIIDGDAIIERKCKSCDLCIKNCPNGALNNNGILNANRCLSYLTQKKNLENIDTKNFNNCIYGCDKCSMICPYNKSVEYYEYNGINPQEFLNMDDEEFESNFKLSAAQWRGKKVLDRNIGIYLKNIDK